MTGEHAGFVLRLGDTGGTIQGSTLRTWRMALPDFTSWVQDAFLVAVDSTGEHAVWASPHVRRYAMSLPVAATISGIDSIRVLHQNLRIARGFVPMSAHEMQALRDRCAEEAADGRHESYKVTGKHEGPVGRKQHGFPESDD